MSRSTYLLAVLAVAATAACSNGPADTTPTDNLDRVEIPEDFSFVTKKSVALKVRAAASVVENGAALEVKREDGRILYMGPIQAGQDVDLKLNLPTKDEAVTVTLQSNDTAQSARVLIDSGEATAEFE